MSSDFPRAGLADIEEYWRQSAGAPCDSDGLRPTARDPHLQDLVEMAVEKWVWPQAKLYDIGCGDGLSSIRFAKRAAEVVGFDYIDKFVEMAKANVRSSGATNLTFEQANVLDLSKVRAQHGLADIIVTIRCLINLPEWDQQRQAIGEIARTLKPGGLYLLSEGWSDGFERLNLLRGRLHLPPLNLVKYNTLLDRRELEDFIAPHFDRVHYESVGFYLVMSRVLQPQLVAPGQPSHTHPLNVAAAQLMLAGIALNEFSDADYAGVYVLRKR